MLSSCKKEDFITDPSARVYLSIDTLRFDTVFTSTGSITQSFKIRNPNERNILISSVKLKGGNNSPYRLIINGVPGNESANINLAGEDSLYVFVSVSINPNNNNTPFIVKDSIEILCNGNKQYLQLEAYGQNAHFLRNKTITENTVWKNDLPYVIIGNFFVEKDVTLTIEAGCKIYLHANAPFIVDGTLIANGVKNNEIVFSGDRLDEYYRDLPASWPGMYFRSKSADNVLRFTMIKNAYQAVAVQYPSENSNPKLSIHQCIIDNAFENGILSINSSIEADNSLISNCGNNISLQYGGNYTFTNCTVASYSNNFILHKTPVLQANNYLQQNGSVQLSDLNATFTNCIFWGDGGIIEDEVQFDKQGNTQYNVSLTHCLIKSKNISDNILLNNTINNTDPRFDNIDISKKEFDFRITKNVDAPGTDYGVQTSFLHDLDDKPRKQGAGTDVGCYEKP
ncbi:MAG: hypothetical protein FGM46_03375 [Ferruginibacter sp.]|nr:hypothetical protein [Ferruginibacter sp.]